MAKSLRCYYTGREGMKCEHCPLSEQQYCGNYTPHIPYQPRGEIAHSSRSLTKSKLISALEKMGFTKM